MQNILYYLLNANSLLLGSVYLTLLFSVLKPFLAPVLQKKIQVYGTGKRKYIHFVFVPLYNVTL